MCRRWTGAAFATLVWFARSDLGWQGEPPALALALAYDSRSDIALAVGTFDDPAAATPRHHYGVEGRLPWADIGKDLPVGKTRERW